MSGCLMRESQTEEWDGDEHLFYVCTVTPATWDGMFHREVVPGCGGGVHGRLAVERGGLREGWV